MLDLLPHPILSRALSNPPAPDGFGLHAPSGSRGKRRHPAPCRYLSLAPRTRHAQYSSSYGDRPKLDVGLLCCTEIGLIFHSRLFFLLSYSHLWLSGVAAPAGKRRLR